MKIGTMQAFASPIMHMTLGEDSRDLNKVLVADGLEEAGRNLNTNRSGVGVGQTDAKLEKEFESYRKLKAIVENVFNMAGCQFFGIKGNSNARRFWFNYDDNPYGYHMPHSHNARDLVSGVYFPSSGWTEDENVSASQNLDEEVLIKSASQPDPGDLVFLDPISFAKTAVVLKDNIQRYPFFGNPICVTPREGTLVLFPCWLPHMVVPTAKPGFTRVSIAFGIDFD